MIRSKKLKPLNNHDRVSEFLGLDFFVSILSRGTLFRHPFVTLFRPETTLFRRTNVTFLIFNLVIRQIIPSVGLEY